MRVVMKVEMKVDCSVHYWVGLKVDLWVES